MARITRRRGAITITAQTPADVVWFCEPERPCGYREHPAVEPDRLRIRCCGRKYADREVGITSCRSLLPAMCDCTIGPNMEKEQRPAFAPLC